MSARACFIALHATVVDPLLSQSKPKALEKAWKNIGFESLVKMPFKPYSSIIIENMLRASLTILCTSHSGAYPVCNTRSAAPDLLKLP